MTGVAASVVSVIEETKDVLVLLNGDVCPLVSKNGFVTSVVADVDEKKCVYLIWRTET